MQSNDNVYVEAREIIDNLFGMLESGEMNKLTVLEGIVSIITYAIATKTAVDFITNEGYTEEHRENLAQESLSMVFEELKRLNLMRG